MGRLIPAWIQSRSNMIKSDPCQICQMRGVTAALLVEHGRTAYIVLLKAKPIGIMLHKPEELGACRVHGLVPQCGGSGKHSLSGPSSKLLSK